MSQEAANTTPKEDCLAFGTISILVPSLESLTDAEGMPKQITSTIEKIGGLALQLKMRKLLNPAKLFIYVYCNEDVKDRLWLCKVQFKAEIWVIGADKPFAIQAIGRDFFGFNSYYWEWEILNLKELEKNPIELKLKIKVSQVMEKSLPALDTNLVVNMGEGRSETLHVNKYLLASFSSYFRNLFFGDWRDKKMEQDSDKFQLNETDDFDIQAFKWMLYGAMTMGGMLQETNPHFSSPESVRIIKLGVKFDIALMVDYCEKSLVKNCPYPKMKLLEVADQYGLVQLKEHCLNEMSVLDFVENFVIHSRLGKATQEELQAKMDEKAGELRASALGLESDVHEDKPKPDLVNRSKKLANALLGKK